MRRSTSALIVTAIIFFLNGASQALTLSLSSPDDLNNLILGQSVTVDVSLSGLAAGEELVTLGGSVLFPGAVFGTPTSVDAGAIVPSPLDNPLDFQTVAGFGQADAYFVTFGTDSADHISANGVFYSFNVTAGDIGSGQIALDDLALIAEQFDLGNPSNPILRAVDAGPPLSFNVIPEPLTMVGVAMGVGFVALRLVRRRRAG